MAPTPLNLRVLHGVLFSHGVKVDTTSDLGAGIKLLGGPLEGIDFGIAVVPTASRNFDGAKAAIFIEIGILAARGIPVIILAEPGGELPIALDDLTTVTTELDNEEALNLHLGLFMKRISNQDVNDILWSSYDSMRASSPPISHWSKDDPESQKRWTDLLDKAWQTATEKNASHQQIVRLLSELLQNDGATVQENLDGSDSGIDFVFTYPKLRETVAVEVKRRRYGSPEQQLMRYLSRAGGTMGLVLYLDSDSETEKVEQTAPWLLLDYRIQSIGLLNFLDALSDGNLESDLIRVRNQMVHRQ
ncbi:restriction endonuclease [Nocardia sp. NPDC020380]|uniref:restriction endonuclease n=1 Tax=Nocardia sp. NPDC020380 TaxID=3364309 RepID=UPI003788FD4B